MRALAALLASREREGPKRVRLHGIVGLFLLFVLGVLLILNGCSTLLATLP